MNCIKSEKPQFQLQI